SGRGPGTARALRAQRRHAQSRALRRAARHLRRAQGARRRLLDDRKGARCVPARRWEAWWAMTEHVPTSSEVPTPPGRVTDRRRLPPGVVPRHLQQWVLVGIALVM